MDDTAADIHSLLQIALAPGVGPKIAHRLLQRFESPSAVLRASGAELEGVPGVGPDRIRALLADGNRSGVDRELQLARENEVRLVPWTSPAYPRLLLALESPPLVLYVQGTLQPRDVLALAVVGPRDPSDYARHCVRNIVPPLCAQGITIVSGLAQGIDAEAHQAALDSGGRTLAVLGQGLATPTFPSSSRRLGERIVREGRGAVISAFPLATRPAAALYPVRNEIIAALAPGTLVAEAGERSGALITAGRALELGRTVMALPGDITRPGAQGSNQLLADGATLIRKSDDVLQALSSEYRDALAEFGAPGDRSAPPAQAIGGETADGDASPAQVRPRESHEKSDGDPGSRDPIEVTIRVALSHEHRPIDFILDECSKEGFDHSSVVQRLLEMEMAGRIRQLPGRIFAWAR